MSKGNLESANGFSIELEIEKLSFGGDGIARKDGLVYFVPFSAPGDRILAKITERKKNFARAEITEILSPSPYRIKPPCPVYGKCGGCNWQHISYDQQLIQKQNIVEEQLSKTIDSNTQVGKIVPSPSQFHYRNRIQLKFDGKNLGFFAKQSHDVISIQNCEITEIDINANLATLFSTLKEKKSEAVPKIELLKTQSGTVETLFEDSPFEGVGFSQVNTAQNLNLTDTILNWTKSTNPQFIYDLYSGGGNFSFPMLKQFPKASLVGVELNEKSVFRAQETLNKQNISPNKAKFFLSDVAHFLKRRRIETDSLVLLDPPRGGCSEEVIQALGNQKIKQIIYLSCNPSALARDLANFKKLGPWKIARVQPFDMFPQTDHIETLVELVIDTP